MATRVYISVIISNNYNKILILQRSATARFAPNQWEFVNGTIESNETAEETAVREVLEETGLQLSGDKLLASPVHEISDSDGRWVVIPFRAEAFEEVHLGTDQQAYKWVNEEEILKIPSVNDDYKALLDAEELI